jgi:hypothetical protein
MGRGGGAVFAVALLAGCVGSPSRPPPIAEAPVAGNPAGLLALLASPTTPAASRQSADRLLVAQKGPREPARLAVLEQIVYAPGHAAGMRMYAMDALAEADPARAGEVLLLYLPQLQNSGPEWNGVLTHACELCVRLGDDRVVESLIRSMHRLDIDTTTPEAWRNRPEWKAIESLGACSVPETLYHVIEHSRDRDARIAALDIVQRIDGPAATIARLSHMQGEDGWLTDLHWWLNQFQTLPTGTDESLWIAYLHRPENAALMQRAVMHHQLLLKNSTADDLFAPRFVAALAYADEASIAMPREALLHHLQAALAQVPHPTSLAGTDETLAGNAGKLTRGDLLTLHFLLQGLAQQRVIDELEQQGLASLSAPTSTYSGLLTLGDFQKPALAPILYPPVDNPSDDDALASPTLIEQTPSGIAQYHLHFQQIHNAAREMPSENERRFVHNCRSNSVIITSIDTRTLDCVYYTPAGAIVDLGIYTSK